MGRKEEGGASGSPLPGEGTVRDSNRPGVCGQQLRSGEELALKAHPSRRLEVSRRLGAVSRQGGEGEFIQASFGNSRGGVRTGLGATGHRIYPQLVRKGGIKERGPSLNLSTWSFIGPLPVQRSPYPVATHKNCPFCPRFLAKVSLDGVKLSLTPLNPASSCNLCWPNLPSNC